MPTKATLQDNLARATDDLRIERNAALKLRAEVRQLTEQVEQLEADRKTLHRLMGEQKHELELERARTDATLLGIEIGELRATGLTLQEALAVQSMRSTGKATPPRPAGGVRVNVEGKEVDHFRVSRGQLFAG